jgi:hypothetical protein
MFLDCFGFCFEMGFVGLGYLDFCYLLILGFDYFFGEICLDDFICFTSLRLRMFRYGEIYFAEFLWTGPGCFGIIFEIDLAYLVTLASFDLMIGDGCFIGLVFMTGLSYFEIFDGDDSL